MVCIPGLLWVWISLLVPLHGYPQPKMSGSSDDTRNCTATPPYLPPTAIDTTERLRILRHHMQSHNLSAYIIPATDAHMSEYIAERDKRLAWMTGFTGSSGTGVVTLQKAALFTDSRYWIQAERQMDCNWELQKSGWISAIGQWLVKEVPEGEKIGLDPYLFSIDNWDSYLQALDGSNRTLVALDDNLVDLVWGSQRPLPPTNTIYQLPDDFIGSTWQEKVSHIRTQMENHSGKPTAVLLSGLEETAWLFNLRGDDIPYTPVFYAYTLLTKTSISLFVNQSRLSGDASQALAAGCPGPLCVTVVDYEAISESLRIYVQQDGVHIWIGTEYTTLALYREIPPEKRLEENYSPVMIAKASKNAKEQELMRAAHVRDAIAVIRYLVWLEKMVPSGSVDEISGANFVNQLRREELFCHGPSFETISASGLNAALAHYSPSNTTSRKLTVDEMYLLDSGGQYLDGTTDITRTVQWGEPTALQKEAYTRVLMGNIDLSRLVFPPRTSGRMVEVLARRPLWEVGLNYGHGTGHGIGNFLSVHEWPVGFQSNNVPLDKGMFTSIEPGYYLEGEFGIRLEDVALVVEAQTKYPVHEEPYLTFEVVSLVPYARNLIDINLLSQEQIQYINSYYESIRKYIGPELQRRHLDEEYQWLQRNTQPLSRSSLLAASLGTLAMGTVASTLLPGA
ncbi:xaa-Pro aminopeptidase 2 [Anolis carolinensis]|uniref:xaa-Pro aminopeptidase 2 n=1 Tax=Anolis carolinensis TaxID=28377 RepID=UPI0002C89321|nr:PREDICTED: xaa-Pro aminopeptidase 2 isoform X1 [Anolis carolinensis]|eukprot:XP_008118437.1 PREDICTED: xaa-Pro aminopeptidase 2 isoform X1 [Anolis carolinensis]